MSASASSVRCVKPSCVRAVSCVSGPPHMRHSEALQSQARLSGAEQLPQTAHLLVCPGLVGLPAGAGRRPIRRGHQMVEQAISRCHRETSSRRIRRLKRPETAVIRSYDDMFESSKNTSTLEQMSTQRREAVNVSSMVWDFSAWVRQCAYGYSFLAFAGGRRGGKSW